ncbi:thiamin pyrophosphokinase 1 isoform X2 [Pararge aegeria]|uniref:thiamin pyrophosphokinase 1 isoform X2 n=1 Tax=Pararge aegeria TaxID=116150 RepID=UPI0019D00AB1|nr:thiamin pyrophosphokinase 1 isoform X2 [Pararge aegeria]
MAMNGILNKVKKVLNVFYVQQSPCGHSSRVVKCWRWNINDIFDNRHSKYAVVVLNRTITQNREVIKRVWNNGCLLLASLRMTVDGGTVHWDKFVKSLPENEQKIMKLPDMITGDFDSITKDILQKYKNQGCKTIHTPNQEHTDFTKALIELKNYCEEHKTKMDDVIAIAQSSGRIDQILGNIQTLYLAKENNLVHSNTAVYIMSDDTLSWLLQPGDHIIDIPEESRKHKRGWCSLVPVGGACANVTTNGLKWNLDNQELKFGKLVSTSNAFDGSELVKIKCSHIILWSMKVPSLASE